MRTSAQVLPVAVLFSMHLLLGCASSSSVVTLTNEPLVEATSEPTSGAELPSIEQFMQILSASRSQVLADGAVFFTTWSTGVDQLYALAAEGGEPVQLTAWEDGVDFYSVSPDGASIAIGASVGGSEQSDLFLMNRASGALGAITDTPDLRYDSPLWSPDGQTLYFRSNEGNGTDFFIYRYDLEVGAPYHLVYEAPGYNTLSDISDDGSQLLVVRYVSNADSDVYLYDVSADPVTETLLTAHDGEVQYHAASFDADGTIWVMSDRDADSVGIGALDPATGAVDFKVQLAWEVEEMAMSTGRGRIAYVTNEDGYGRLHLLDVTTGESRTPDVLSDGIVSLHHFEGDQLALGFASATRTSDVWVLDTGTDAVVQKTFSDYAGIDPGDFRDPELIRYPSFDGREIPAFLYLPPDYDGGIVPTIIHVHGGPESQFRPAFIRHFQYLMLNGFAVLAPNVRGSSGYGPEYMALDNYRNRLDSVADIGAAVDWLLAEGYTDEAHLGIKGGSYGGYMVMAAITQMPTRFAAASETVGIVNFVTFLENTADYRRALREAEYGPLSDREFLESISPIHHIDRIQTPLLVIHGENDSRVPVGEARQVIEALEASGRPVESLIFANEGHGIRHLDNRLLLYRQMVDFFTRYLNVE